VNDFEEAVAVMEAALKPAPLQPFPWRDERSPFLILVAELMLVRTRADLVVPVFNRFKTIYPTAESLAQAQPENLVELLASLGLLKRIPLFQKAAVYIHEHLSEGLPSDRKSLETIPGVGRYTADAVRAFAFDQAVVPADVNVLRWISRVTGLPMVHSSKGSAELRALLPVLTPLGGRTAYKLIDFIREICRPRKPRCADCPIRSFCHYGRSVPAD
jgi:A/G-specific adenine glycosylase